MSATISIEKLTELCEGLHLPDTIEDIYNRMVLEEGLRGAAKYYAASFSSYSCHRLAGRLGYLDLMQTISKASDSSEASSIQEYIKRVSDIIRPEVIAFMAANAEIFQSYVTAVDKKFGMDFDWLMFMSHETSYLLRDMFEGEIIETPALMHFRVISELFHNKAGGGAGSQDNIGEAITCFELATEPFFTFASPVFFNSGHSCPNLCSCFLINTEDSLTGIMGAMYKAALVSKATGGIGLNVSSIRHSGIGRSGTSRGIIPMLQVYDRLIRYVDQTGKRNGASTVFLQAHHIDLLPFIRATLKHANAKDSFDSLNTAIVFPDLFWERLKADETWTLFCPAIFPGLNEVFGEKYRELYLKYETMPVSKRDEQFRIRINARDVADTLADSQIMSGMPYVLHKDSINMCSNQVNLNSPNPMHHRTIQSSNLCLEIMEQTDSEEVACCNLGQLSLKAFVSRGKFDFVKLGYVTRCVIKFLDRVIDRNKYVVEEARTSNMRHRPIGLGVSGYADMLNIMKIPYESDEASEFNRKIFACMYYNALVSSLELAIKSGPYSSFFGSPLSEGKFSFDLWKVRKQYLEPDVVEKNPVQPEEWGQDPIYIQGLGQVLIPTWDNLRNLIKVHGVRNSQMMAIMPSASTSRLMGNAENTEAHQSNLYLRNFMKASAVIITPQLFEELDANLGVWSRDVAEFLVSQEGSVARLPDFLLASAANEEEKSRILSMTPQLSAVCRQYKTMFEIKQLKIVDQVADRHRYLCQGISYNVYLSKPSRAMLKRLHMYTHRAGLKTGMYYLREPQPSESPEYARTSSLVRTFLTGPVLPLISSHEPFRGGEHPDTIRDYRAKASKAEDHDEIEHASFTKLLAQGDVEVISASVVLGAARAIEEEGPACYPNKPGCVGCGS